MQDVCANFVATFQRAELPPEPRCMAWLATALANAHISKLRKDKVRRQGGPFSEAEEPSILPPQELPEPSDSELVTDDDLKQAVRELSRKQLEVFEAISAGKRYAEVAEELGIREGAVAKRLFDARQRLRKALKAVARRKKG